MSSIYGVWKHKTGNSDSSMLMTQMIHEDGSYETQMIFAMGDGCQQHIYHFGTFELSDAKLRLKFESGKTQMIGCEDPSKNYSEREFNQAETNEAKSLLAQAIPYSVEENILTTTVQGPMGEMKVVYSRQVE